VRPLLLSGLRAIVLLPSCTLVLLIRLLKWLVAPPALLFQLLLGIPLVLLRIRQPLRPRFIPQQEADLPDEAWIALTDAAEALAADGFVHYGDFRCDQLIQGAVLRLRLLGQPEQGIGALAAHVEIGAGARPSRRFVEFSTEFEDGRVLDTNNLDLPYSLPAPAYLARVQLKDVWDPRALYVLHHDLVASLRRPVSLARIPRAVQDPAGLLADGYAREIDALIEQGWLRPAADGQSARLSLQGALAGVWRQAWPLAGLYLRAADRRARRLLAGHGIDAASFAGGAVSIVVARQQLPADTGAIDTIGAGYEFVRPLAQRTDPNAVPEAVVVELGFDPAGALVPREFRYSFRGGDQHPQRRIRRLWSFDILLDPGAGMLSVTAMDREFEQADDEAEWARLSATSPLQPLWPGPRLRDLDTVLPAALAELGARVGGERVVPDSASLYTSEDGVPCWQVVAWSEDDAPLHVRMDARY
jgi:hypothetical protein